MPSMICERCDVRMKPKMATLKTPYRYGISGLSDVSLCGIQVYQCEKCCDESPVITRISKLHEMIALSLVRKPGPLTGEELRFLRKYAGFPAKKFATLIGVSPEHLSRFENGEYNSLDTPLDRLARALVWPGDALDMRREQQAKIFRFRKNNWLGCLA